MEIPKFDETFIPILEVLKSAKVLKSRELISKYCGKIKLKKDPLKIQKELRDEWE